MKISHLFEIQTESLTATKEEIATVVVNMEKGFKLRQVMAERGKLCFILEHMVGEGEKTKAVGE